MIFNEIGNILTGLKISLNFFWPFRVINQFQWISRCNRSQLFFQIGALNNFAICTGKHLRWSLFVSCRPSGIFPWILRIFEVLLFYRTRPVVTSELGKIGDLNICICKNIWIFFNNNCWNITILKGPFPTQLMYFLFYFLNSYFFETKYTIFSCFSDLENDGMIFVF